MINTAFEAYKVRREIKRSGRIFSFARPKLNDFKEPTEEQSEIGEIRGIYHEQSSHVKVTTGDTTQIRSKKIPMILCLYNDVELIGLKMDDRVSINGKTYKVTGVVNIQEWNIIADVSLEVVDDGIRAEV